MTTYLLHSGGLDSHIAWLMHPTWRPVYVAHAAANEDRELRALTQLAGRDRRFNPEIIGGPDLEADFTGHIPMRNLLLLSTVAAKHPDAAAVAYGALLGEGTGDKSARFRRQLTRVWGTSERPAPTVIAPLRRWTKAGALRRALPLPGAQWLPLTWSCYDPTGPCGLCQACFRRGIAEYLTGMTMTMPTKPTLTKGPWHSIRSVPLTHLPSMAAANVDPLRGWWKERHAQRSHH